MPIFLSNLLVLLQTLKDRQVGGLVGAQLLLGKFNPVESNIFCGNGKSLVIPGPGRNPWPRCGNGSSCRPPMEQQRKKFLIFFSCGEANSSRQGVVVTIPILLCKCTVKRGTGASRGIFFAKKGATRRELFAGASKSKVSLDLAPPQFPTDLYED